MKSKALRVAGFGMRRSATLGSLADALERLEDQYGPVDRLAAADSMQSKVEALGAARGLETLSVPDAALASAETRTHSPLSRQARGTGSVAEAVARLAAGPGSELLGPRLVSPDRRATAAMASAVLAKDAPAGDLTTSDTSAGDTP